MNIVKEFFVNIKRYFKNQSKITYGLFLSFFSIFFSTLSVLIWFLENIFFVARPSEPALWSSLVILFVCFVVWVRLWLLSFHIMYPKGYVKPIKTRDSWIVGNAIIILFATIPNAYFINPYDSHIMSYLFIITAILNLLALYLFKNFYIPANYEQKKWLGRMMIIKSIPPFLFQFIPK